MAISSLVVKASAVGAVTVGGSGAIAAYCKWDYLTDNHLFELEKKLLNKSITLTVAVDSSATPKKNVIVTTAQDTTSLGNGKSWKCKLQIESTEEIDLSNDASPKNEIEGALQDIKDIGDDQSKLSKRRWFVKNCSKHRTTKESQDTIESLVKVTVTKSKDSTPVWNVDSIKNLLKDFV